MAYPLINPKPQFTDLSGVPLANGQLEFRDPDTNALKPTYPTADDADAATNANSNPVLLNLRGECDTGIFLVEGESYKVTYKDASGVEIWSVTDVACPTTSFTGAIDGSLITAGTIPGSALADGAVTAQQLTTNVRSGVGTLLWRNGFESYEIDDWTTQAGAGLSTSATNYTGAQAGLFTYSGAEPSATGLTEAVYVSIPEEIAALCVGRTILVACWARSNISSGASAFRIAYSANDGSSTSDWQTFNVTSSFQQFSFTYTVPTPAAGGEHAIAIVGDDGLAGLGTIVDNVSLSLAAGGDLAVLDTVSAAVIDDATLTAQQFAATIRPVGIASSAPTLPDAINYPTGATYFNTTDGLLYETKDGSNWSQVVHATDMAGQIDTPQIADLAVTSAKINDLAANKITAGTINAAITTTSTLQLSTNGQLYTAGKTSIADADPGVFMGWDGVAGYDFAVGTPTNGVSWDASASTFSINGRLVGTGNLVQISRGSSLNPDPAPLDSTAWGTHSGSNWSITTVTDGQVGNSVIASSASAANAWVKEAYSYAFDPAKVYRLHVWARRKSGDRGVYLAVDFYDSTGTRIAGTGSGATGWTSLGTMFYWGLANDTGSLLPADSTWREFTHTFGASGGTVPAAARTMLLGAILNYQSSGTTNGVVEIQDIRVEEVIPSALINDLSASKITAGTINADITHTAEIILSTSGNLHTLNKDSYADTTAGVFLGYDATETDYVLNIGDATEYLKWDGTTLISTSQGVWTAGDRTLLSAPTERTEATGSFATVKSFYIARPGTVRVDFRVKQANTLTTTVTDGDAQWQIKVAGSIVAGPTTFTTTSYAPITSQDVTVAAGDSVTIEIKGRMWDNPPADGVSTAYIDSATISVTNTDSVTTD